MHTLRASEAWRGDTMKRRRGSGCWLQSWRLRTLQLRVCPVCAFFSAAAAACSLLSRVPRAEPIDSCQGFGRYHPFICLPTPHADPLHSESMCVRVCACVCSERLWFFFCLNAATEWVPSLQSSLDFTVNLFVIRNHFGARTNKAALKKQGEYFLTTIQQLRGNFQDSYAGCPTWLERWQQPNKRTGRLLYDVMRCDVMLCDRCDLVWCDVLLSDVMWYDVM